VMHIYDLDYKGVDEIKRNVRQLFLNNAHIKDERVIDMLVEKGYMDFEDTLLQHKQKTHLLYLLEGPKGTDNQRKLLEAKDPEDAQFARLLG
jgi:NADH dehydrogenase (ubiquinone) 1 alpha subcomplex subunit 6